MSESFGREDFSATRGFLLDLFDGLDRTGVKYCVLRNYENLPDETGNDVDFLCDRRSRETFRDCLLAAAGRNAWHPIKHLLLGGVEKFFFMSEAASRAPAFVRIDVTDALSWHGLAWGDACLVLDARRRRDRFWIPCPGSEGAISLFTRWVPFNEVKEAYRERIGAAARDHSDEFLAVIHKSMGERLGEAVRRVAAEEDWETLGRMHRRIRWTLVRRSLLRAPIASLACAARCSILRLAACLGRRKGVFVVLVGPDGSGKSTVACAVGKRLSQLLPEQRYYHGRFGFLPELKRLKGAAPERGHTHPRQGNAGPVKPHGPARALAYVVYYSLDYLAGHFTVARVCGSGGMIVFDRYFYDYLIQPGFTSLPKRPLAGLAGLLPRPDAIVYLRCSPEAIHERKPELDPAEIRRQQQAIEQWLLPRASCFEVRTDSDPARAASEVCAIITDRMKERCKP